VCGGAAPLEIDWQATAAIATLAAVFVALLPIWREALRTRARARSLRFRISSKLTILRPSLLAASKDAAAHSSAAVLSQEQFRNTVRIISNMMQESSVLETEEQDHLGVVLSNLETTAILYGTNELPQESARDVLSLIDRAVTIMSEYGVIKGEIIKPWQD
jgi:hypothetical protein